MRRRRPQSRTEGAFPGYAMSLPMVVVRETSSVMPSPERTPDYRDHQAVRQDQGLPGHPASVICRTSLPTARPMRPRSQGLGSSHRLGLRNGSIHPHAHLRNRKKLPYLPAFRGSRLAIAHRFEKWLAGCNDRLWQGKSLDGHAPAGGRVNCQIAPEGVARKAISDLRLPPLSS